LDRSELAANELDFLNQFPYNRKNRNGKRRKRQSPESSEEVAVGEEEKN
jgi:hypothetical protein